VTRPRIALDVQFGPEQIRALTAAGFDIVVHAEPSETDASWLARAAVHGVEMVCSPDTDVEIWAYDHSVKLCRIPGHERCDLVAFVVLAWAQGGVVAKASAPIKPNRAGRRLAKRIKRARGEARRRERVLLDARSRILAEESERVIDVPARLNTALAGVGEIVNATMQTEPAWRATWADELAARGER